MKKEFIIEAKRMQQLAGLTENIEEKKDYLVKGDNQTLVRVEDSIQTIEDALDQIITDPKKNTQALAKYAMDALKDIKELLIK